MAIIYDDEEPSPAPKPKITYEERRAEPAPKALSGSTPANAGLLNFGASLLGTLGDTGQNILNLGRAAVGTAATAAGRPDLAPEIQTGAVGTSEWLRQKLRETGLAGLNPDNPNPKDKLGTTAYELTSRGGFLPGGVLPAVGSMVAEKIGGPAYAPVGAMVPGAVGQAVRPMAEDAARRTMQVALKPSLAEQKSGDAARAITTMLDNGFNATRGGVEKMRAQIDDLNTQIARAIENSPATVNKVAVGNQLRYLLDRVKSQVNPNADIAAVQKAWGEFMDHPLLQDSNRIPVQLAQQLKQGTYRELGNKAYDELKSADIESQKSLARGLKEEVARAVPAVGPMNARESELINAMGMADKRAMLDGNRNFGGFSWLAHSPMGAAGMLADRSALALSLGAHGLHSFGTGATPNTLQALLELEANRNPRLAQGLLQGILSQGQR